MNLLSVSLLSLSFGMSHVAIAAEDVAAQSLASKVVPQVVGAVPEGSRVWRAPNFDNQSKALGYTESAFAVPKGMEKQVQFWVDIYSKYSTTQGVIHDSENVDVIYEVVDLAGLKTDRERQRKIDAAKKLIGEKLTKDERERMRYQLGQKDRMQSAIFYSGRYMEDMEAIFKEAGLPIELTRLAFVESSFNVMARSKVGASGLWQIMGYTARPYRMVTPTVDKRNHPMDATRMAAKLLKINYSMLESWPLAVTGYNHGPTGVRKITEFHKTRDISALVQKVDSKKTLGFASRNFYASFLAALEIEKNAQKYYGTVVWSKPLEGQDLKLPVAVRYKDILAWFDGDDQKAQLFNPHLTSVARKGRPIPAKTVIAVPKDRYNVALITLARKDRTVASER